MLKLAIVLVLVVALGGGGFLVHTLRSHAPSHPSRAAALAQMEDMKAALRSSPRFALCSAKGKKLDWSEARLAACVRNGK